MVTAKSAAGWWGASWAARVCRHLGGTGLPQEPVSSWSRPGDGPRWHRPRVAGPGGQRSSRLCPSFIMVSGQPGRPPLSRPCRFSGTLCFQTLPERLGANFEFCPVPAVPRRPFMNTASRTMCVDCVVWKTVTKMCREGRNVGEAKTHTADWGPELGGSGRLLGPCGASGHSAGQTRKGRTTPPRTR